MDFFTFQHQLLHCEDVHLRDIADEVGTPTYVYSHRTLARHARIIDTAWGGYDHLTCYSVKANSSLAILQIVAEEGLGADIVSGGELFRALRAGFTADKIVFSGVGKTASEMRYALREGILAFNVESVSELAALNRVAGEERQKARVNLRINPDVDPKTHPKIATGLKSAKFGIPHSRAVDAFKIAAEYEWLEVVGIDCHIGSSLTSIKPFVEAAHRLLGLVEKVRAEGIDLQMIDIGGGLGIRYDVEDPPSPAEWAGAVGEVLAGAGLKIVSEPGRSMVGNAGAMLTRVLYLKENEGKQFVVVDAGMNDLARPAMYDAYHRIEPVFQRDRAKISADIVGPICETGDALAKDREIVTPEEGDLLAVMSAGAYGYTMASTYNSRPRPAEVVVRDGKWQVVRDRETYDDLVRGERALLIDAPDPAAY
jgi:diaminopimelate decarboxylase